MPSASSSGSVRLAQSESPLDTLKRVPSGRAYQGAEYGGEWERRQGRSREEQEGYGYGYQYQYGNSSNYGRQEESTSTSTSRKPLHLNLDQTAAAAAPLTPGLHSPLLHGHFRAGSQATAVSNRSYLDDSFESTRLPEMEDSEDSPVDPTWRNIGEGYRGYVDDGSSSLYPGPALRDSMGTEDGRALAGVPTLVISSPDETTMPRPTAGRTPMVKPVAANFSRPVRESGKWEHGESAMMGESVMVEVPADMREQKKVVLERNAGRKVGTPTSQISSSSAAGTSYRPSPLAREASSYFSGGSQLRPERATSPVSLYSTYSYYQYDGLVPTTPTDAKTPARPQPQLQAQAQAPQRPSSAASGIRTPLDYLQLGIQHHEANRLEESVRCFERSAKEDGGCGVGMLMYGLSLRHGWGCVKNEALGFKWVLKAAQNAVGDLEKVRTSAGTDPGPVEAELVLAIYEVGQCFFHGWGVGKDSKMGVSYYSVAARLGDGDAQADLAFCLANGKGCKKNKKEAARWYRAAVAQGQSDVGLGWIYKDKYQ